MKTKNKRSIRLNLRIAIVKKFQSQARFAYESGIDEAVISKIINGVRDPSEDHISIMTKLLGKSEKALFKKVDI